MSEDKLSFQVSHVFQQALERWISILGFGVLGSIIAFGMSFLLHPRYEASAAIAVSVDYGRTEIDSLVTEDRVLDRIWQLMVSDETFEQVVEELIASYGEREEWASIAVFRDHARLDARLSRWEMIGIHSDPDLASAIANAWQDVNLRRLNDAMEHAWEAQSLQGVSFEIGCVNLLTGEELESLYHCVTIGPGVSPEVIDVLKEEISASHGIHPGTSYEKIHKATPPQRPSLWSRGLLVLSGGIMGVIIGIMLTFKTKETKVDGG
jgi:capsular polysaccharide biosynthesis protein